MRIEAEKTGLPVGGGGGGEGGEGGARDAPAHCGLTHVAECVKLDSVVVLLDIECELAAGEKEKEQRGGGSDLVQVDGGAADFGSRVPARAVTRREAAKFERGKTEFIALARAWGKKMMVGWG
jgi:hypothetical protein